ncbi:MAG TPA: hypothetical protein VKB37_11695 [Jatrophihabitantaceae bacterium]|nr:hypothetical protein [Jatrophihabitantaceae bacterium]
MPMPPPGGFGVVGRPHHNMRHPGPDDLFAARAAVRLRRAGQHAHHVLVTAPLIAAFGSADRAREWCLDPAPVMPGHHSR